MNAEAVMTCGTTSNEQWTRTPGGNIKKERSWGGAPTWREVRKKKLACLREKVDVALLRKPSGSDLRVKKGKGA